jgi:hypothetical protein
MSVIETRVLYIMCVTDHPFVLLVSMSFLSCRHTFVCLFSYSTLCISVTINSLRPLGANMRQIIFDLRKKLISPPIFVP